MRSLTGESGALKRLDKYDIEIYKLKNGLHEYIFEVDDSFFNDFEDSLIQQGKASIDVALEKGESLIKAVFRIKGRVMLTCDRSLREFEEEINLIEEIIYKYGEISGFNENDEIIFIPQNTQKINVAGLIYEFMTLSLPMKKLHPDFRKENEEGIEDGVVYQSHKDTDKDKEQKDSRVDPRWEKLKKYGSSNNDAD